jgi:hypothetical protein
LDISGKSDSKTVILIDFMDIFQYLNNLWHNNNSLDNLFKDLRYLHNLFDGGVHWDFNVFESVNDLDFSLNVIDGVGVLLESIDSNSLFSNSWNLTNLSIF